MANPPGQPAAKLPTYEEFLDWLHRDGRCKVTRAKVHGPTTTKECISVEGLLPGHHLIFRIDPGAQMGPERIDYWERKLGIKSPWSSAKT
jgi:hypothetical protein